METNTGTQSFNQYLEKHKSAVKDRGAEGFYHVDVVAEAYSQGFADGEKSGKKIVSELLVREFEKFSQRANQIYILSQRVIDFLKSKKYTVTSLHINLNFEKPSVVIAIPRNQLNNDVFVKTSYEKIFEVKDIYSRLFSEYLDIGLTSSDDLDTKLLMEDGYGYIERYAK